MPPIRSVVILGCLHLITDALDQAKYTAILTLACTAATSCVLVVICMWIAYEQWGRFATQRHAIIQKVRSHLASLAVSSGEKSTPQSPDHTPYPDPDSDPDPEIQRPSRRKTETSEFRKMKAGVITTVRDAARVLMRGIHPSSVSMDNIPDRPTFLNSNIDVPRVSPFSLLFNKQIKVLDHTLGDVRDLEFSPDGILLAVTRSVLLLNTFVRVYLSDLCSYKSETKYSTTIIKDQFVNVQPQAIGTHTYVHSVGRICQQISW